MRFYELAIIYFAIGAPIATTFYFRNRRMEPIRLWALAIGTFFFWLPIIFVKGVRSFVHVGRADRSAGRTPSNAAILERIRAMTAAIKWSRESTDLREALERYSALTSEISRFSPVDQSVRLEIFSIAANRNEVIGSACLSRKNQAKLTEHQERASRDLIASLQRLVSVEKGANGLISDSADLALDLGDKQTAMKLLSIVQTAQVPAPDPAGVGSVSTV